MVNLIDTRAVVAPSTYPGRRRGLQTVFAHHETSLACRPRALEATPMSTTAETEAPTVHILWINAGLSCDGDSVALTAATQPSIEEIAMGALPGLPKVAVH